MAGARIGASPEDARGEGIVVEEADDEQAFSPSLPYSCCRQRRIYSISMVICAWFARVLLVWGDRVPQSLSFLREGSADNSSVPPSPSSSRCPSPLLVPASLPPASFFNSIEICFVDLVDEFDADGSLGGDDDDDAAR